MGGNGLSAATAYRSRILPVKLLSSAPSDHALAQVQACLFSAEGDDGIPLEYHRGSQEYKESMRKLAYAVAQVLHSMPSKQNQRATVYLAPDFNSASDKLRAALEHHFDVLPEDPQSLLSMPDEEFQQSLERNFARCFVSVHPLNCG